MFIETLRARAHTFECFLNEGAQCVLVFKCFRKKKKCNSDDFLKTRIHRNCREVKLDPVRRSGAVAVREKEETFETFIIIISHHIKSLDPHSPHIDLLGLILA